MWLNPFIPSRILIKREEDYHTHYIGQTGDGRQFFGYQPFIFPHGVSTLVDWTKERREYVVLYPFDKEGNLLTTKHWYAGTAAETDEATTKIRLEELIQGLGPVEYGDIKIKPFKTVIDGYVFGLVPKLMSVDLEPSASISFTWPWDGEYYT